MHCKALLQKQPVPTLVFTCASHCYQLLVSYRQTVLVTSHNLLRSAELLQRMRSHEREHDIEPDWNVHAFQKAQAIQGQQSSVATEYVIRMLGLDICADTICGNHMMRGISGGQKKRVTSGWPSPACRNCRKSCIRNVWFYGNTVPIGTMWSDQGSTLSSRNLVQFRFALPWKP